MRIGIDCFGLSDTGRVRESNEDQFLVADLAKSMLVVQTSLPTDDHTRLFGGVKGRLLVVADGMGGHAGGRRASGLAVETLARYVLDTMPWFLKLDGGDEAELDQELKAALEACQRRIEAAAAADPGNARMGTTLTMAYILWPKLYVVHAGDSRCYLLRDGTLHRVTRDHTVAQQMIDHGVLTPAEAESSRWSHVLWNCVGGRTHDLNPDVYKATLQPGDSLLLCSDGLSKYVADDRIGEVLGGGRTAAATARQLVDAANDAGGSDNITVVVAHTRADDPGLNDTQQIDLKASGS